jgi:general stress protein 26
MYTHEHARIHYQNVRTASCVMLFTNVYNGYIASRDLTFTNKQTNKHAYTLYVCTTYVHSYVTRLVAFKYVYFTRLAVYRNIYQNGNILDVSNKTTGVTNI